MIKTMKIRTFMSMMLIASATVGVEAQQLKSGIDITNLNQTVKPGEDFYQYACGGWMKKNPLPAAYSRFGSFDQLQEDNNKRINSILKDLSSGKKKLQKGTVEQKLGDFYKLAMDQKRRNREGISAVQPILKELEQDEVSFRDKYDAVFHLVTAAKGALPFYTWKFSIYCQPGAAGRVCWSFLHSSSCEGTQGHLGNNQSCPLKQSLEEPAELFPQLSSIP